MKSLFVLWFALLTLSSSCNVASSQILLKPKGDNAVPLRIKSLDAQVKIRGQFAESTLTYVFQNETSQRIEADFMYTVPQHATVTYFAYWYGEEKVVARVVEKERAAQIYQYITTRQRDPALIELVGKNTFRARIFPIMPHADLRIELRTVQVLPSNKEGAIYTLPLRGEEEGKGTFEQLNVEINGVLDGAFSAVGNNFGQRMTTDGAQFGFTLKQSNYRAPRDLQIILKPRERDLRVVTFAKNTGSGDGFFSIALSPKLALRRPRVALSGVKTYDIAPAALPSVATRGTLLITGRYRGSGTATLALRDGNQSWTAPVPLTSQVEANHLATKLWAARRIADLSGNKKNQNAVMALSKRFTLPSKWTSWLAIPKEEIKRYQQEKAQADLDYYGRLLGVEYTHGRGKGKRAAELRTRFNEAAKVTGNDSNTALKSWAQSRLYELSYSIEDARGKRRARIVSEIRGLSRMAGVSPRNYLNRARAEREQERREEAISQQLSGLSYQLARELLQRGDTKRAKQLHRRMKAVEAGVSQWFYNYRQEQLSGPMTSISRELVQEKMREKVNQQRIAQLQNRLNLLAKYTDNSADDLVRSAEWDVIGYGIRSEAHELVQLRHDEKPDQKRLAELEAKFARYNAHLSISRIALNDAKSIWGHEEMHRAATLMTQEKLQPAPDAAAIAKLQKRFDTALSEVPDAPKDKMQREAWVQRFFSMAEARTFNEPLWHMQSALETNEKQQAEVVKAQRARYTAAHQRLAKNTPNPMESSEMRVLLDKAEKAPDTLSTAQRDTLRRQLSGLMRWGDPLISIEAPQDALQVIALLPGGEIKRLTFNAQNGRWEVRFDIPTYAPEGEFPISVIIVAKDGSRRVVKLNFRVDGTTPQGQGVAKLVEGEQPKLRLELQTDKETARVAALLPWGEKVELKPSAQREGGFFALVPLPAAFLNKPLQITYVLTDRAHNRTTLMVDMSH